MSRWKRITLAAVVLAISWSASAQGQMLLDPPRDMKWGLDRNGSLAMPDIGAELKNLGWSEAVTTTQTPPPGTVYAGPQLVWVEVAAVDASSREDFKRFRVELVDEFPPDVAIVTQASSQPLQSPCGGQRYYVAPVEVTSLASATDLPGTSPRLRMLHNGLRYDPGTPITVPGLHFVTVIGTDDSGNETRQTDVFEIRTRPNYSADIWVEQIVVSSGELGVQTVLATVRLTASAFPVRTIHPDTLNLWLETAEGNWIRATGGGPILDEYHDCYHRLMFFANVSQQNLAQLPPRIVLTGRTRGDLGAESDFIASALAQNDLIDFVPPCHDNDPVPEPVPPVPCEWKTTPCMAVPQACAWANYVDLGWSVGSSASTMNMWVTCTDVSGNGGASLYLQPLVTLINGFSTTVTSSCAKTNTGFMRIWLEGTDCCHNCTMHVVASPHITGNANISGNASASISGAISVASACGGATASGSATVSDSGGNTTIQGVPTPLPSGATTASFAAIAQPPLDANCNTCDLSITFATGGTIDCSARVNLLPNKWWNSSASCQFGSSGPGLTVTPSVNCPPGEGGPPLAVEPVHIP